MATTASTRQNYKTIFSSIMPRTNKLERWQESSYSALLA
jgi:hypothetical protein